MRMRSQVQVFLLVWCSALVAVCQSASQHGMAGGQQGQQSSATPEKKPHWTAYFLPQANKRGFFTGEEHPRTNYRSYDPDRSEVIIEPPREGLNTGMAGPVDTKTNAGDVGGMVSNRGFNVEENVGALPVGDNEAGENVVHVARKHLPKMVDAQDVEENILRKWQKMKGFLKPVVKGQ